MRIGRVICLYTTLEEIMGNKMQINLAFQCNVELGCGFLQSGFCCNHAFLQPGNYLLFLCHLLPEIRGLSLELRDAARNGIICDLVRDVQLGIEVAWQGRDHLLREIVLASLPHCVYYQAARL